MRVWVHLVDETSRHLGQADIVRELIDGSVGARRTTSNLPEHGEVWWASYRERVEAAARASDA